MGRKPSKSVDATQPLGFMLRQPHVDKAVPCDNRRCALVLGLKAAGAQDVLVNRNVVQVKRRNRWRRYMAGSAAKLIIALVDKGNKKKMTLPDGGLRLVLEPPKGVRTQEYRRSPKFKALRKASRLKNKHKKVRRTYRRTDAVSLQDIRNGAGCWV